MFTLYNERKRCQVGYSLAGLCPCLRAYASANAVSSLWAVSLSSHSSPQALQVGISMSAGISSAYSSWWRPVRPGLATMAIVPVPQA
jgi:hypothetical protein